MNLAGYRRIAHITLLGVGQMMSHQTHVAPLFHYHFALFPANGLLSEPQACVLRRFSRVQLYDPVDCSPPASSIHGILQARILEWVALPSSRGAT